jgi:hypothetical protein
MKNLYKQNYSKNFVGGLIKTLYHKHSVDLPELNLSPYFFYNYKQTFKTTIMYISCYKEVNLTSLNRAITK